MAGVLIRREDIERHMRKDMERWAETEDTWLQAKESLRRQKLEETRRDLPLETSEGTWPC